MTAYINYLLHRIHQDQEFYVEIRDRMLCLDREWVLCQFLRERLWSRYGHGIGVNDSWYLFSALCSFMETTGDLSPGWQIF